MNKLLSLLSLEKQEIKLLLYSVLLVFLLFAAYAFLRPIRDALGIEKGTEELKWLFLGTFLATLICSLLAMNLSGMIKRKLYADGVFIFFALNLIGFYLGMLFIQKGNPYYVLLCRTFFIWVSVFNLFVISTAWSVLADTYTKERSTRLFGIISAGASVGSIIGSMWVGFLGHKMATHNFILLSGLFLFAALILKNLIIQESYRLLPNNEEKTHFHNKFNTPLPAKNPFSGIKIILQSNYLLLLCLFIVLLTSVSTFLYMEQARIVKIAFESRETRTAFFAKIDFVVQTASFIVQIFLTAKIAKYFGSKSLLSLLGFVLGIGFMVLIVSNHALWAIIIVYSLRRIGEYALVKPAREMLFVPLDGESKYKVKNFTDTVVYRGGDALSSQLEGFLADKNANYALLAGGVLALLWGFVGLKLSQKYENNER